MSVDVEFVLLRVFFAKCLQPTLIYITLIIGSREAQRPLVKRHIAQRAIDKGCAATTTQCRWNRLSELKEPPNQRQCGPLEEPASFYGHHHSIDEEYIFDV